MWNKTTRGRMVALEKKTKRYPSDLTDEEWDTLQILLPQPSGRGRKRTTDLREVINALRYMKARIAAFSALPVASLDRSSLATRLREIGRAEGATRLRPDVA